MEQDERNQHLLRMILLFERVERDLEDAVKMAHFEGLEQVRARWTETASDFKALAETAAQGLTVQGHQQARQQRHTLRQDAPMFQGAVLLRAGVVAGEYQKRYLPAGMTHYISWMTTFPGKVSQEGRIAPDWEFWIGFALSEAAIFGADAVAELRLRDNIPTRLHFAGAPFDRAPFPVVWVPDPEPLFPVVATLRDGSRLPSQAPATQALPSDNQGFQGDAAPDKTTTKDDGFAARSPMRAAPKPPPPFTRPTSADLDGKPMFDVDEEPVFDD